MDNILAHRIVGAQNVDASGILLRNDVCEDFVLVHLINHHTTNEILSQIVVVKIVGANRQHLLCREKRWTRMSVGHYLSANPKNKRKQSTSGEQISMRQSRRSYLNCTLVFSANMSVSTLIASASRSLSKLRSWPVLGLMTTTLSSSWDLFVGNNGVRACANKVLPCNLIRPTWSDG